MTTTVVIVVYNRLQNVRHWIDCWKQCNQSDGRLVVIHNADQPNQDLKAILEKNNCGYIHRPNVGFDIGAFQDVCMNRLPGFPAWQRLLWCTDDTWPMRKDFVQVFNAVMNRDKVGVACMQISGEVRKHIRTTGFMIDTKTAQRLRFHAEPIMTKEDCYQFEHRHPTLTLYDQITAMGLNVVQVAENRLSPLWDSEYKKRLNRRFEHDRVFKFKTKKEPAKTVIKADINVPAEKNNGDTKPTGAITFICPIYNGYPQIVSSLLMQTYENWKLWLIHDGPGDIPGLPDDDRITVIYTQERRGNWGHSYRSQYLQKVSTEFVAITNHDNYHAPVYVEYLLSAFKSDTVGAYCSDMVHSYSKWNIIRCKLERGYIDCAGMVLRTKEAQAVGWNDITSHSADWFFFNDLIKAYGERRFVRVPGCLLVHN